MATPNALMDALVDAIECSGYPVAGPTDPRAAEHGEPAWVCRARAALADAAVVPPDLDRVATGRTATPSAAVPSLTGIDPADMTAVQLQALLYAERAATGELVAIANKVRDAFFELFRHAGVTEEDLSDYPAEDRVLPALGVTFVDVVRLRQAISCMPGRARVRVPTRDAAITALMERYGQMLAVLEKQSELLAAGCQSVPSPRQEALDDYRAVYRRAQDGRRDR